MEKAFTKISLIIIFVLAFSGYGLAGQFKVTKVYDGDTIMAEGHDIVIYVLLAGIDAPELSSQNHEPDQPYGQAAKHYLERQILNKTVEIKGYGIGPYPFNHLIGEIYRGNTNINVDMVMKGLAEVSAGEPPVGLDIAPYLQAEKEAKAGGRGMWSLGDRYISPKEWRKARIMK
jgi:endonuclease YncB( thermonuclease family)